MRGGAEARGDGRAGAATRHEALSRVRGGGSHGVHSVESASKSTGVPPTCEHESRARTLAVGTSGLSGSYPFASRASIAAAEGGAPRSLRSSPDLTRGMRGLAREPEGLKDPSQRKARTNPTVRSNSNPETRTLARVRLAGDDPVAAPGSLVDHNFRKVGA